MLWYVASETECMPGKVYRAREGCQGVQVKVKMMGVVVVDRRPRSAPVFVLRLQSGAKHESEAARRKVVDGSGRVRARPGPNASASCPTRV